MPGPETPPQARFVTRPDRIVTPLVLTVATGVLGYRFFGLIDRYAVNVFFFDQWDFLKPFFDGDTGLGRLFLAEPTPFREGLGLIVDKFLYAATAWNVRAESFLIGACVFTAMLLALVLKRKLFGRLSPWDVAIPLMFLPAAQFETFVGTPNPSYSGIPLVLLLLYCLALLKPNYKVRFALCLVLNFFLVYTGYGMLMGPVTLCIFGVECYRSLRGKSDVPVGAAVAAVVIAAATLGSFFIDYRFEGGVGCFQFPDPDLPGYPHFMALMLGNFLLSGYSSRLLTIAGTAVLTMAVAILALSLRSAVKGKRLSPVELASGVLLAYSLLFAANAAVGRVCVGLPQAALASRYLTQMIPGALGIYCYLQSISQAKLRMYALATLVVMLIPNQFVDFGLERWYAEGKRAWADCYILTEDIDGCDNATHFQIYPRPQETRLKEKLDYLKEHHLNLFAASGK